MKRLEKHLLGSGLIACALASASGAASAQSVTDYPVKPIQLVICYAPGGGLDIVGRIVAERVTRNIGRLVVVENRPGAGGNIGTAFVAKAPADGYTLLETTNNHNINPLIYKSAGYDPRKDFVAVAQLTEAPSVIVANPRGPFGSLQE